MARKASTSDKGGGGPLDASARVVILHGKDAHQRSDRTAELRRALEALDPELQVINFDGLTTRAADVLDECRSFGLMASHKLVIVDNADGLVKEDTRPLLERYCSAPSESATLVLRAERWYKGKLDDMVAKVGAKIACEPLSAGDAAAWAVGCASEHGASLDKPTAQRLVDRVGTDTGRLAGEIGKLAVAATVLGDAPAGATAQSKPKGKGPAITAHLIDVLVGDTREDDVWQFQDVLVGGNAEEIVAGLARLLDNAPRDTAVLVTISMIDAAKKLHAIGAAIAAGQNPRSLTGKLKIWPDYRATAIIERAGRSTPGRLRSLYHAAVEADLRQKSGLGRSHRTLERLAIRFARV